MSTAILNHRPPMVIVNLCLAIISVMLATTALVVAVQATAHGPSLATIRPVTTSETSISPESVAGSDRHLHAIGDRTAAVPAEHGSDRHLLLLNPEFSDG